MSGYIHLVAENDTCKVVTTQDKLDDSLLSVQVLDQMQAEQALLTVFNEKFQATNGSFEGNILEMMDEFNEVALAYANIDMLIVSPDEIRIKIRGIHPLKYGPTSMSQDKIRDYLSRSKSIVLSGVKDSYNLLDNLILDKCNRLELVGCEFNTLPSIPNCRSLSCQRCYIATLPDVCYAKSVKFINSLMYKLPKLPLCEELVCNDILILEIPPLPKCKKLICINNPLLEWIHDLPECEFIVASRCNLVKLPELPKCQDLDCSYNNMLETPQLDIPSLNTFKCTYNHLIDRHNTEEELVKAIKGIIAKYN